MKQSQSHATSVCLKKSRYAHDRSLTDFTGNGEGHIARDCPEAGPTGGAGGGGWGSGGGNSYGGGGGGGRECYRCGETGHIAR
jgi:hypothetical protein